MLEGVPALCGEGERIAVAGNKPEVGGLVGLDGLVLGWCDVPDDIDIIEWHEFLVVMDIAGEEQLIILSSVECAGDDVQVHLLGECSRLVVNGQFVLVDITAYLRLRADVEEL